MTKSNLSSLNANLLTHKYSAYSLKLAMFKILGLRRLYIRALVKRRLLSRSYLDYKAAWGRDTEKIRIVDRVSKCIADYCNWPNNHFFPNDYIGILLSEPHQGFESVQVLQSLQAHFKLTEKEVLTSVTMTMGSLIDVICSRNL